MSEWFTVEKIDSQTFAISEYKHWKKHTAICYVVRKVQFSLIPGWVFQILEKS